LFLRSLTMLHSHQTALASCYWRLWGPESSSMRARAQLAFLIFSSPSTPERPPELPIRMSHVISAGKKFSVQA
jgi:hypothetical protein